LTDGDDTNGEVIAAGNDMTTCSSLYGDMEDIMHTMQTEIEDILDAKGYIDDGIMMKNFKSHMQEAGQEQDALVAAGCEYEV